MPTTSWIVLRGEILRPFGYVEFKTTTNLVGGNTNVDSTGLTDRFDNDDRFNNWWATLVQDTDADGTPANGAGLTRIVDDYTVSSSRLTLQGTNLAGEDEQTDWMLSRHFHPDEVRIAFNRAVADSYPHVSQPRDSRTIVTEAGVLTYPLATTMRKIDRVEIGNAILASDPQNLLTNGGFEEWDTDTIEATETQNSWTLTGGSSFVYKESATTGPINHMVLTGSYSARLYVPSSDTTLLQAVSPSVATQMVEVSMSAYVYCRAASSIALQLDGNTAGYHGGTGWELLEYSSTTDINDTSFNAGFFVNGASSDAVPSTSYIDRVAVWAGPREPREGLWEPVTGWEWMPSLAGASDGGKIHLRGYPKRAGEVLRVIGRDAVSTITSETGTVEIDGHLLKPLYALTRAYMCEAKAQGRTATSGSDWAERAEGYHVEYQRAIDDPMFQATSRPKVRQPQVVF